LCIKKDKPWKNSPENTANKKDIIVDPKNEKREKEDRKIRKQKNKYAI
jgi:hypothetical protein